MKELQRWECRVATNANGHPYIDDIEYSSGRYVLHSDHEAEIARAYDNAHFKIEAIYSEEIARLRAEVDAYRKDAERYRWLRDLPQDHPSEEIGNMPGDMWDEQIDAAMGASA